ncbi:MAG: VCBS repeat-containing protein, partial [Myxococcota bacterium]
ARSSAQTFELVWAGLDDASAGVAGLDASDIDTNGDGSTDIAVISYREEVRFRVRGRDEEGLESVLAAQAPIAIGNSTAVPGFAELPSSTAIQDLFAIEFSLDDTALDLTTAEIEFREVPDGAWRSASIVQGSTSSLIPSPTIAYVAVWDTRAAPDSDAAVAQGIGDTVATVEIRLRGREGVGEGRTHFGAWSNPLELPVIRNQNAPRITNISFPGIQANDAAGTVLVTYALEDDESDPVDVQLSFRRSSTQPWIAATEFGDVFSSGTRGLMSRPDGTVHSFRWDTRGATTPGLTQPLELRIAATDGRAGSGVTEVVVPTVGTIGSRGLESLLPAGALDAGALVTTVLAHDFDQDGHDELIVGVQSSLAHYTPGADGTWVFGETIFSNPTFDVQLLQVDGNGPKELVFAFGETTYIYSFSASTFSELTTVDRGSDVGLGGAALADFDGDGLLDLVFAARATGCRLFRGNSTASLFEATGTDFACLGESNPELGLPIIDVNGDEAMDFVRFDQLLRRMYLYLGQPSGLPTLSETYELDRVPLDAYSADFDDDGSLDLAVFGVISQNIAFYSVNESRTGLSNPTFSAGSLGARVATVADLNRDGHPDFISAGIVDGLLSVGLNRSRPGEFRFDVEGVLPLAR